MGASHRWFQSSIVALALALCGAGGFLCAQVTPGKEVKDIPLLAVLDEIEEIKVNTSLVDITASVFGKDGKFVTGLSMDDFIILENGVEQQVEYFANTDQPFTVILLLDLSGSMELNIESIKSASLLFLDGLKPADRIAGIVFDQDIRILNSNMRDRETLKREIKALTGARKGTFLYPVVEAVSGRIMKKISGRKALVLFTDGIDGTRSGVSTYQSSIQEAVRASAPVFSIQFNPDMRIVDTNAHAYLEDLAKFTGGKVFRDGISGSFKAVTEELRRQYSIGYYPQTVAKKNEVRKIEIRVKKPGLVVRSRNTYIGR
jgi:Ca-activated chloride channel homolog